MARFLHHIQSELVQFWQLDLSLQARLHEGAKSLRLMVCFLSKDWSEVVSFCPLLCDGISLRLCFNSLQLETLAPSHSQPFVAIQVWQVWTRGHHSLGEEPPSSPGHSSDFVIPKWNSKVKLQISLSFHAQWNVLQVFVSLWKPRPTTWFLEFMTFSHMNSVLFQTNWVFKSK